MCLESRVERLTTHSATEGKVSHRSKKWKGASFFFVCNLLSFFPSSFFIYSERQRLSCLLLCFDGFPSPCTQLVFQQNSPVIYCILPDCFPEKLTVCILLQWLLQPETSTTLYHCLWLWTAQWWVLLTAACYYDWLLLEPLSKIEYLLL